MPRYRLTELAEEDLVSIWTWIARESGEERADPVIDRLEQRFRLIAGMPGMGKPRDDLAPGLRCLAFRPYLILYRSQPAGVDIVRVLHGGRDIEAVLEHGQ